MNVSCSIIKDILPLYTDEVCSEETKKLVDEHIDNCDACSNILAKMKADIKTPVVLSQEDLKKSRDPFKKIRNRFFRLCIITILFAVAIITLPYIHDELTTEKHNITIGSNIQDIDFGQLSEQLASILEADGRKLYNVGGFNLMDIDTNGDILNFNTSFILFRDDKSIHFQTNYKKDNKLLIQRSWDINLNKEEVAANYNELPISLLDRIPWDHLLENLVTANYDKITISNRHTGDGMGNIRIDPGTLPKSFLINDSGEIITLNSETVLPFREYQVINFSPAVYYNEKSASGRMEIQYFFKVN